MVRASGCRPEGCRFESCRPRFRVLVSPLRSALGALAPRSGGRRSRRRRTGGREDGRAGGREGRGLLERCAVAVLPKPQSPKTPLLWAVGRGLSIPNRKVARSNPAGPTLSTIARVEFARLSLQRPGTQHGSQGRVKILIRAVTRLTSTIGAYGHWPRATGSRSSTIERDTATRFVMARRPSGRSRVEQRCRGAGLVATSLAAPESDALFAIR